jgi:hypothetical protein
MPHGGRGVRQALPALREAYEQAGRDPGTIQIVPVGVLGADEGKLAHFAELGITETVLQLPLGDESEVLRTLDEHTQLIGAV